jgi:hypothetical protein
LLLAPPTAPPLLAVLRLASLLLSLAAPVVAGLAGTDALLGALLLLLPVAPLLLLLSNQASSCAAYLPASKQALLPMLLLHSCSSFRQARGAPAAERWLVAAADAPAANTCVVSLLSATTFTHHV